MHSCLQYIINLEELENTRKPDSIRLKSLFIMVENVGIY